MDSRPAFECSPRYSKTVKAFTGLHPDGSSAGSGLGRDSFPVGLQTPVALICYGCFRCHLSLVCYPLPGTDREHSKGLWGGCRGRLAGLCTCEGYARRRFSGTLPCDGPPRMVARSTWSGRERSSHSRFLPVPRVGLVTFAFFRWFSRFFSGLFCSCSPPRVCASAGWELRFFVNPTKKRSKENAFQPSSPSVAIA